MRRTLLWVGLCFGLVLGSSCKKPEGGACFKLDECADGLACVGEGMSRCEKCSDLKICTVHGKCTAQAGVCVAASPGDCKKSDDCKARGPCTLKDGMCVVGGDADCAQSESCAKQKYCVAQGNNCIMSESDSQAAAKAKADAVADAKLAQQEKEARAAKEAQEP